MPTHLSGPDGLYIFIGLLVSITLLVKGVISDMEQDAICRECTNCAQKKQQRSRDRAEARVQGFIRDGICPKCRWMHLEDGHCASCGKDWR